IELLRKAVTLDPGFALAKARLAYRIYFLGVYSGDLTFMEQAISLAEAAATLDPTLAYPPFVLGSAASFKGQDALARLSFLRALELDPANNTGAMNNLSVPDTHFGR